MVLSNLEGEEMCMCSILIGSILVLSTDNFNPSKKNKKEKDK